MKLLRFNQLGSGFFWALTKFSSFSICSKVYLFLKAERPSCASSHTVTLCSFTGTVPNSGRSWKENRLVLATDHHQPPNGQTNAQLFTNLAIQTMLKPINTRLHTPHTSECSVGGRDSDQVVDDRERGPDAGVGERGAEI